MALSGLNSHTHSSTEKTYEAATATVLLSVLIKCFISDHCESHCGKKRAHPPPYQLARIDVALYKRINKTKSSLP